MSGLPIGESVRPQATPAGLAPGRPDEGISTPSSQKRAWWGPRRLGLRVLGI